MSVFTESLLKQVGETILANKKVGDKRVAAAKERAQGGGHRMVNHKRADHLKQTGSALFARLAFQSYSSRGQGAVDQWHTHRAPHERPQPHQGRSFRSSLPPSRRLSLLQGKSDPYCFVSFDKQRLKSKMVKKTLNPVWDETFAIRVHTLGADACVPLLFAQD